MCQMPRSSHIFVMNMETNVTKFVQCEAEYELGTMREVYWCLFASCQMRLLTLRFESNLNNRVTDSQNEV